MGQYQRLQIVTKEKLNHIPAEVIHFVNGDYIHFPLKRYYEIEGIKRDFGQYKTIGNLILHQSNLSKTTLEIIMLVEKLDMNSFMVDYEDSPGDAYPPMEVVQLIVKDRIILQESILDSRDENSYDYCETVLGYDSGYWNAPFESYDHAEEKYFKTLKG